MIHQNSETLVLKSWRIGANIGLLLGKRKERRKKESVQNFMVLEWNNIKYNLWKSLRYLEFLPRIFCHHWQIHGVY